MKLIARFFVLVLCIAPYALWADAPLSGTAGSNLTAFSGTTASFNNSAWNQMINARTAPSADFGNCNALILRCAQPRCASGGCISMEIAYPIVSGCVMSNDSCKGHGDALIQTIAAQIVANSVARANEQAAAAQQDAAAQMTQQSEQQMQQMQMQMQQMQTQMAQQSAQQAAAIQSALEEQKQLANEAAAREAAAREEAARAQTNTNSTLPSVNVTESANMGVSADVLAREQASGQILTQLENAEVALKTLKTTMQNAFEYAGCDRNGNNCAGPKRVKAFKQKAGEFFDPYETVLDEVYDALIYAQSLGVNLTDIYMMLNGSCNVWGKYLCKPCRCRNGDEICMGKEIINNIDDNEICDDGFFAVKQVYDASENIYRTDPKQRYCTLAQMLSSQEEVQQNWMDMGVGDSGGIRVACASDAIESSKLFRSRKKQASIDIETLQRMILQDASDRMEYGQKDASSLTKICSVSDEDIHDLQTLVQKKSLSINRPGFGKICVPSTSLHHRWAAGATGGIENCSEAVIIETDINVKNAKTKLDAAKNENNNDIQTLETAYKTSIETAITTCKNQIEQNAKKCNGSGGKYNYFTGGCDGCDYNVDEGACKRAPIVENTESASNTARDVCQANCKKKEFREKNGFKTEGDCIDKCREGAIFR